MSDGWLGTAGARIGRAVGVRLEDGDIAVAEGVERMALAMLYIRAASGLTDAATDMEVALSVDRLCRENSARGELARLRKEHDAAQTLIRDVHEALDAFGWRRDALVSRVNRAVAMMDALRRDLRDLQEAHELALAELSRPLAEREAELRAAFGADDVDAVIADRDDAIRRADASEARLRLVGDAVAALVEVARG
jgi:hypothetical protein